MLLLIRTQLNTLISRYASYCLRYITILFWLLLNHHQGVKHEGIYMSIQLHSRASLCIIVIVATDIVFVIVFCYSLLLTIYMEYRLTYIPLCLFLMVAL